MNLRMFRSNYFTRAQVEILRAFATAIMAEPAPTYTVAELPSPALGARAIVTDATSTTFHSLVAGGGLNTVPVFADGAAWRIG